MLLCIFKGVLGGCQGVIRLLRYSIVFLACYCAVARVLQVVKGVPSLMSLVLFHLFDHLIILKNNSTSPQLTAQMSVQHVKLTLAN